ncbi:MAG: TraR/DksA C4-type zinc finger protein [Candidatus Moranbacteria bacterium]|nr:TraR/DksA C4-type zinc finger protein [Candidatus Moranbacteria bacterium]
MIDPQIQEELKQKLLEEKKRIENTLSKTETGKKETDREYETTFPEVDRDEEANADEMDMYESNLAADETMKSELEKIEKALTSIDKGTYGFCINCQKEIPIERLHAYPQADTCIDCDGK